MGLIIAGGWQDAPMSVLEGIRVVELGAWVAGPGAGGLLADWGADVVKVEAPAGDPMRRLFAVLSGHGEPQSPPFDLDNRGKRSVVLDLRDDAARDDLRALVATADVFLTNLRPDAVERLGFGPDDLLQEHPRLVYAQVSGYGRTGPDAHRAGYDLGAFFARSGLATQAVPPDQPPVANGGGIGDHITGTTIVAGICAALFARERTGRGQVVDTSLLRAGIYTNGWPLSIQLRYGKHLPTEPRTAVGNPLINSYRAGDGRWFWLLGLEADRHWPPLVRAIGRPDLVDDERFASAKGRRVNARELVALLDEVFAGADRDHWIARFDEHDVWWAPVNTLADVVEDEQAEAAGAFVDVPDGAGAGGHRGVMTPVDFSDTPVGPTRGVPGLGEHTEEVLDPLRSDRAR
jgi:crotonobetainyl-CoA:carnitine CoA-transferase CaiB-like acyl-CoA transferase